MMRCHLPFALNGCRSFTEGRLLLLCARRGVSMNPLSRSSSEGSIGIGVPGRAVESHGTRDR